MEDITIPEGYEAKIEGNKIVFVKKESYDEKIRKALIEVAREVAQEQFFINRGVTLKDVLAYLERQKPMYNLEIPAGDVAPAEEVGPFDEDEFLEGELSAFLQNYDKTYDDDAAVSDVARHFYEIGKKQKEQKSTLSKSEIDFADTYSKGIWEKLMSKFKNTKEYHIGCNDVSDIVLNAILDAFKWVKSRWNAAEEGKPKMIQWTGKNLKEVVDFTGKSPRFDEWFKSWEDFENYVHSHGDIFKLFCEDGSHLEVPVGAWIVKTPDGFNTPSHFRFIQKPVEWSKEDEDYFQNLIMAVDSTFGEGYTKDWLQNRFKSLLERVNPQPGLSKEDFIKFGNLEYERGKQDGIQSAERVCWKPSELEKGAIRTAIHILIEKRAFAKAAAQLQNILNAFEGKESRKDWKPSKEQLAALEHSYRACYRDDICSLDDGYQLRELYNKLIEIQ